MWSELKLTNFKSFREATVPVGPFTVIVGTNASGKSNIRDAFRFLHGIGRNYGIAETIGSKTGDGGEVVWRGIRGGIRGIAYSGQPRFRIISSAYLNGEKSIKKPIVHTIEVDAGSSRGEPEVTYESLTEEGGAIFVPETPNRRGDYPELVIDFRRSEGSPASSSIPATRAILSQIWADMHAEDRDFNTCEEMVRLFGSVRFFDLVPDKMRLPTFPGQTVLGDQGDNLSSVLFAICKDARRKESLLEWVRELTPMDAEDFEFPTDQIGRVLLTLVEADGRRTSAYSASDGTLRFLAIAAGLLGPEPAKLFFFEELDNGIHPTRLHLLVQLIERAVKAGKTQVIATTHSPYLLGMLSEASMNDALLVYRLPHHPESRVKRIVDLPNAKELIAKQSAATLHASGWFESAVYFTEGDEE